MTVTALETPAYVAVIVTEVVVETGANQMLSFALVAPAAIVIELGTEARSGFELVRATRAPPIGAIPFSVTTASSVCEDGTVDASPRLDSASGDKVRVVVFTVDR